MTDSATQATPAYQQVSGRDVAALFDPRPVVIVGACDNSGNVGLATIIWATPVSHDPVMVAFALRAKSHTMQCLQESKVFSLNILPKGPEGERITLACGTATGHKVSKGELVAHRLVEGVPVVDAATSWAIYQVNDIVETGDHLLVTGTCLRAATTAPRDEKGQLVPEDVLLCAQHGHYL